MVDFCNAYLFYDPLVPIVHGCSNSAKEAACATLVPATRQVSVELSRPQAPATATATAGNHHTANLLCIL